MTVTSIKTLYVFVDIGIDVKHFVDTVRKNFEPDTSIILVATIQFMSSLQASKKELEKDYSITIPQSRPLSPGEVLGCTSPKVTPANSSSLPVLMYLGDGRFHLESIMISNPRLKAFRYDPYSKQMTREHYDHQHMRDLRSHAIKSISGAKRLGYVKICLLLTNGLIMLFEG